MQKSLLHLHSNDVSMYCIQGKDTFDPARSLGIDSV